MAKLKHYDVDAFNWISIVCLSATVFIQSLAITSLPMPMIAEILPLKIRVYSVAILTAIMTVCGIIISKCVSPYLKLAIGLDGVFFLFSAYSLLGALFVIFYVPETKGKNYNEIMELLR